MEQDETWKCRKLLKGATALAVTPFVAPPVEGRFFLGMDWGTEDGIGVIAEISPDGVVSLWDSKSADEIIDLNAALLSIWGPGSQRPDVFYNLPDDLLEQKMEEQKQEPSAFYPVAKLDGPPCVATWGNCDPASPIYFGHASDTPHHCKGGAKHYSKLHVCQKCGGFGARMMPTALTRAGRELKVLIAAREKDEKEMGIA